MQSIGLALVRDIDIDGTSKTEFKFPPAFSVELQRQMIGEMQQLDFISKSGGESNTGIEPMHVSFGVPTERVFSEQGLNELLLTKNADVSDLFTFAFVSAERVKTRKPPFDSVKFYLEEQTRDMEEYGKKILATDLRSEEGRKIPRLEFRAMLVSDEVMDNIDDMQNLVYCMVSSDERYCDLAVKVFDKVDTLRREYGLRPDAQSLPGKTKDELISVLEKNEELLEIGEEDNLISKSRKILEEFSEEFQKLRDAE